MTKKQIIKLFGEKNIRTVWTTRKKMVLLYCGRGRSID